MSAPTAQWERVMRRAGIVPAVLVQIDLDGTPVSVKFVSGSVPLLGYQPLVAGLTPSTARINPIPPRKAQVGDVTIKFKDSLVIRDLVENYPLRGRRVKVFLGCAELTTESDWYQIFGGAFDDHKPARNRTSIELRFLDAFSLVDKDVTFQGRMHPLSFIEQLLTLMQVPSELIDSDSFDPDDPLYSTNIGHWQVIRELIEQTDDRTQMAPQKGLAAIDEVASICNGVVVPTNEGKIRFARYDHTTANVRTWDKSLIRNMRQRENTKTLINKAVMNFGWSGGGNAVTPESSGQAWRPTAEQEGEFRYRVALQDDDSIARYVFGSTTEGEFPQQFSSKWFGVRSFLEADISSGASSLTAHSTFVLAFCGSRQDGGANAAPHANRPVYLKIDNEIIKCDAVTFDTDTETIPPDEDEQGNPHGDTPTDGYVAVGNAIYTPGALSSSIGGSEVGGGAEVWKATYTVAASGRGAAGTAAAAHTHGAEIIDVTIAVQLLAEIVGRASDGLQIIEVDVPLWEVTPDYGDNVGITHDAFLAYGYDGLAGTEKWEVIGKTFDPLGGRCVSYLLASVRTPPSVTSTWSWPNGGDHQSNWPQPGGRLVDWFKSGNGALTHHVADGLLPAATTGRNITIPTGSVLAHGVPREVAARGSDYQLPASKDTYIWFDGGRGTFLRQSVANGAAAPATPPSCVLLAKAVTNATDVTSVVDMRPRTNAQLLEPLFKDTDAAPVGDVKLKLKGGAFKTTDDADAEVNMAIGSPLEAQQQLGSIAPHTDGQPFALTLDTTAKNWCTNPSFEVDASDWDETHTAGTQTIVRDSTIGFFGTSSLKVTVNNALTVDTNTGGVRFTESFAVDDGTDWVGASVRIYNGDVVEQTVVFAIDYLSDPTTYLGLPLSEVYTVPPGEWVEIKVHPSLVPAAAGITHARARIRIPAASAGSKDWWIDGLLIEKEAAEFRLSAYFDGSFGVGFAWDGTAHASTSTREGGMHSYGSLADTSDPFIVWDDGAIDVLKVRQHCAFSVYRGSNQSINENNITRVNYDTEEYDYGGNFEGNDFTAPRDGVYQFSASVFFTDSLPDGTYVFIYFYKNGAAFKLGDALRMGAAGQAGLHISGTFKLDKDDFIDVRIYHDQPSTTTAKNISGAADLTWFSGALLFASE